MLTQIDIRDFATIEQLQLNLHNNATMITGETGSGKSIFIEAIELTLGGRASQQSIRAGKEKADISLCFDINHFPHVIAKLKEQDLYLDSPECIIRRVISIDGRSRCYVNGIPVTLQIVKELGELLFHLHGQHEQQVLLRSENQREMLDRFADHLALAQEVKHLAEEWRTLEQTIFNLKEKSLERSQRVEFLRFQLEELQALKLADNEWETLEGEHKRLSHCEELLHIISHTLERIHGDDGQGVLTSLHDIRKSLETITNYENKTINWLSTIESVSIQIADLESELQNYIEKTDIDPIKIRAVEARISEIFNLARKYKIQPSELPAYTNKIATEFNALNISDEQVEALQKRQALIAKTYEVEAKKLTQSRKQAASKLEKIITTTIRSLSLPHGEFKIQLEHEGKSFSIHGLEKITFLIKTNPDQAPQPLAKIISGGELSRLSLAAHLALANKTNIPTLVFDEVDTGLSGATAEKIGKLLRKLGESYQVFCVTHQAQVAACGHHHLLVQKQIVNKITHTQLRLLKDKEKTNEIARMIGGEKITAKTLAHAEEMLEV